MPGKSIFNAIDIKPENGVASKVRLCNAGGAYAVELSAPTGLNANRSLPVPYRNTSLATDVLTFAATTRALGTTTAIPVPPGSIPLHGGFEYFLFGTVQNITGASADIIIGATDGTSDTVAVPVAFASGDTNFTIRVQGRMYADLTITGTHQIAWGAETYTTVFSLQLASFEQAYTVTPFASVVAPTANISVIVAYPYVSSGF